MTRYIEENDTRHLMAAVLIQYAMLNTDASREAARHIISLSTKIEARKR